MSEDYEYRGLVAEAWDLLRGDTSTWTDRLFWRRLIDEGGQPALDVGCGTGRLLLPYLADGLDVDGVDISPEMLALCRAKAAAQGIDVSGRLHQQAMDRLDLPRRYALIFVPSLSFQLLLEPAEAEAAMVRFRDNLAPAGQLALSYNAKFWRGRVPPTQMQWSDWEVLAEQPRADDDTVIRRWIRVRYDHVEQLQHEENRYEVLRDGSVIRTEHHGRSPAVRWYSVTQATALFERAGFTDILVTAEDGFEPAAPEQSRFKIRGVRP